jgi:NAD(P)-dependent dehydrogenase (short-subunit alcohol dehydrogenase family)
MEERFHPGAKKREADTFSRGSLNGKVAIVTGASSGIGRATALALAGEGVRQVITARSTDRLESLAKELPGESLVVASDMTNPEADLEVVQRAVEHFGSLDILLANAGIYVAGTWSPGIPMPGIDSFKRISPAYFDSCMPHFRTSSRADRATSW